jgi:hypothetical protein
MMTQRNLVVNEKCEVRSADPPKIAQFHQQSPRQHTQKGQNEVLQWLSADLVWKHGFPGSNSQMTQIHSKISEENGEFGTTS